MSEIALVGGVSVTLVDEADFDWLCHFRWHARTLPDSDRLYARTKIGGRDIYMHRMILRCPPHLVVDHRNGHTLDNRRANLRVCTIAQNSANRRRVSKTGFRGVYLISTLKLKPWRVKIRVSGKYLCGGLFATKEEAARRYDELARQHFGEFAILNFAP